MNGGIRGRWQKLIVTTALAIATLAGLKTAVRAAPWPPSASRFVHYFKASGHAQGPSGTITLWERIVYSLILANSPGKAPARTTSS